jgi:acetate---CoA ligase (ADP-forming)
MSCSGGEAALVADMALDRERQLPALRRRDPRRVAATLNDYVGIDNPLDYHTFIWDQPDKLFATFSEVLSGGFDVAMLILDTPTHPPMDPTAGPSTAAPMAAPPPPRAPAPSPSSTLHEVDARCGRRRAVGAGVAPLLGLDDALTALEAAGIIGPQLGARGRAARNAAARDHAAIPPASSASMPPSSA